MNIERQVKNNSDSKAIKFKQSVINNMKLKVLNGKKPRKYTNVNQTDE